MAGIKLLRKTHLGQETTAGTWIAPTTQWRGPALFDDQREIVFVDEDIGYISGVDRTYIPKLFAALTMEETEATFEQFPHVLEAGIDDATPTQDGSGSGYVNSFVFPVTAGQESSIKTYAFEGGDNQQTEIMEYGHVVSFTLSGRSGEAWMLSAEWAGRQVQSSAGFTAGISLPAVEEILFGKTTFFIDAVGGTIGGTEKSNTLLEAVLQVTTGLIPKFAADGELYFSFLQAKGTEVTLDMTYEHNGSATTEKAAYRAETARQIRLLATGSAFTTAGTTYTYKTMIIDLAGKWERFDPLGEIDGNDVVSGKFRARYNATAALFAEIVLVNALSALP